MDLPLKIPEDAGVDEIMALYDRALAEEPGNRALLLEYADVLCNGLCLGGLEYEEYGQVRSLPEFRRLKQVTEQLPPEEKGVSIYLAVISLLNGRSDLVIPYVKQALAGRKGPMDCGDFAYGYLLPLKRGFKGMWNAIGAAMREAKAGEEAGLPELCAALELFYREKHDEAVEDALTAVLVRWPDNYLASELLGRLYMGMKLWKNALACFQRAEEKLDSPQAPAEHIDLPEYLYFDMAWCSGKAKRLKDEERYYRKSLALFPVPYARNNLAYCLYRQRRYGEAEALYRACVADGEDLRHAVNGLARTLLAGGKLKEARLLLDQQENCLSGEMKCRIREGRCRTTGAEWEEPDGNAEENRPERPFRSYQFTSERILEDELVSRMERGQEVFDRKLSVYEKKGAYGRQFPLPDGRIDILAVDREGNLYAVELKKDSGYDDAYAQTARYVDYLEKHMAPPGKKVYGIICLSDPPAALVERVRQDGRMELYEYRLSYARVE